MTAQALSGRIVVITGASSGIGAATAQAVAQAGGAVALLARRTDRIEALAATLTDAGARALAVPADVTVPASLHEAARRVADELGRVDALVNNAGQMLLSPFADGKTDEWRRMIEINVAGALWATDAFLPALRDGGGDVVTVSSVAGRKARPTTSVYSGTKWALGGWSEGLRQELAADHVRVTLIEPGAVRTELAEHISDPAIRAQTVAGYDEMDALHPQDVAGAIVYALSQPPRVSINEILLRPTLQLY
jgi:NADP-dependent 3-hydroxy acid dehydrogenase YdfG